MPEEYTYLFNAITDALQKIEELKQFLQEAQLQAEILFIERTE